MALEVGRLIGHHGVADRVGLVEGIVREIVNLLVNGLCRGLRDTVCHTAGDVPVQIAVEEGLPFLLNVLRLLFAHGPADHIRLSQRIARQVLENLDDLLLINDAAIGDGQNRLQGGMAVLNELWVLFAGDESGDGVHGPGTVEGNDRGDVLNILGFQPHTYTGHAGGFHLEYTGGLPRRQHFVSLRVLLRDIRQAEIRLLLL